MTILVAETYRMHGHAQHDAQKYVPAEELEEWRDRDPIDRCEAVLRDMGEPEAELFAVRSAVAADLDKAVDDVLSEPAPEADDARTRVYGSADLDASVPWTRGPVPGYGGMATHVRLGA